MEQNGLHLKSLMNEHSNSYKYSCCSLYFQCLTNAKVEAVLSVLFQDSRIFIYFFLEQNRTRFCLQKPPYGEELASMLRLHTQVSFALSTGHKQTIMLISKKDPSECLGNSKSLCNLLFRKPSQSALGRTHQGSETVKYLIFFQDESQFSKILCKIEHF